MKTTYAAGIVGILAIAVIAAVGLQAMQGPAHTNTVSGSTTSALTGATSTTTSSASTETQSSSSSAPTTSTTSQGTTQAAATGDFAMMATDPPVVASGVTAATATYSSISVHSAGSSGSWTQLQGSGTINLMSSANVSQTIAAQQVATGTYDMVQMGIQSASVTYQGKVYAAAVASGTVTSHLQSDAQVTASQSSAAIVDLRTFVINTANSSQPQFVFSATAMSTTVPPSATTSSSLQVGAQTNLQGSWWTGFQDQTSTKITVTSATLTSGSLALQLSNSGNASADIQTIEITPVSATGTLTAETMPSTFSGSAVFSVSGSGSVQASNSLQVAALLGGSGTQCAAGSSTTLNYSGSISLGLGVVGLQLNGVVSGQQYLVTVMGANTYGSVVVTAQ